MCVDADVFLDMCELYPETANDLKVRSLERRQFFQQRMLESEKFRRFKTLPSLAKAFMNEEGK